MKPSIKPIVDFFTYLNKPKCVIMKGIRIDNRCVFFIGYDADYYLNEYSNKVVKFKNMPGEYYARNIEYRVWTIRNLIKWRRIIGNSTRHAVLEKTKYGWKNLREQKWGL